MRVEPMRHFSRERLLAYAGGALFVLIALIAVLLWAREGELVYVSGILSGLANCL